MHAVWKLGRLLAKVERQKVAGPGRGKVGGKTISGSQKSFMVFLAKLELQKDTAVILE